MDVSLVWLLEKHTHLSISLSFSIFPWFLLFLSVLVSFFREGTLTASSPVQKQMWRNSMSLSLLLDQYEFNGQGLSSGSSCWPVCLWANWLHNETDTHTLTHSTRICIYTHAQTRTLSRSHTHSQCSLQMLLIQSNSVYRQYVSQAHMTDIRVIIHTLLNCVSH